MKKITRKLLACLMAALLLCMPVLTGCDKPEDASETTVAEESKEATDETTAEATEETTELDMSMYSEGLEFTSDGGGSCRVSGLGTCTDKDVAIPPVSPEGDRVTEIEHSAFWFETDLTSITIPDSVRIIGIQAFAGCSGLTSLTLPDSVRIIKEQAFAACSGLTSITVQEGNPAYHSEGNCLIATEDRVLVQGCKNSVIPADGSVTSIEAYAFYGCEGLMSLTIPTAVTSIGEDAFAYCSGLASIVVQEGNSVYHSAGNCLIDTANKELTLGCKNSEIPTDGSVTSIGAYAFIGCEGLTNLTIPAEVTKIGGGAFIDCSGLASITVQEGNSKFSGVGNCLIQNTTSSGGTLLLGCKNSVIPDDGSVKVIQGSAFRGCTDLTSIIIPDGVRRIGDYTFKGCTSLTSIIIPDGVKEIGDYTFEGCTSLTSITIPDSVTSIARTSFYDCDQLKQEEQGVYYVDRWVVDCDRDVETVTLRADTVGIGEYAFADCYVTSIKMPDTVVIIGDYAFSYCRRLASVTMSNNLTYIGNSAFNCCDGLTNILIADSVTFIGGHAFNRCTNLTSITIPSGATISNEAFYCCSGLTSVTIQSNVSVMSESVFDGCFNVTDVHYDGTLEQWKESPAHFKNATIHCTDGDITPEQ